MKRTIKFRVWDNQNKKWLSVVEVSAVIASHQRGENPVYFDLMQFTGLIDKNGKEIYEGDVIKSPYTNSTFKVFYSSDRPEFVAEFGMTFLKSDRWSDTEIIGNQFDNPELLNQ